MRLRLLACHANKLSDPIHPRDLYIQVLAAFNLKRRHFACLPFYVLLSISAVPSSLIEPLARWRAWESKVPLSINAASEASQEPGLHRCQGPYCG